MVRHWMSRKSMCLADDIYLVTNFFIRMATKFAGQYIQSFINIMKTQFGLDVMMFGRYLDNKDCVSTFKYVQVYYTIFSFDNIAAGNRLSQI